MKEITYEEALDIVGELTNPESVGSTGIEAWKGYHQKHGNVIVVVGALSGALLISL
jgi:hypothetical protein